MNKELFDGVSIMTAIGAFIGWLPSVSATITIVWMLLRIYETRTVQTWLAHKGVING